MTTNKPGVLGYFAEYQKAGGQFRLSTNHFETRHDAVRFAFIDVRAVPVIRLSDYEALQDEFVIRLDELSARNYELRMGLAEKTSECEQLRKDAERYRYIKKGNQWIVAATQTGAQVDGEVLDELIDIEMEQQK